MSMQTEVFAKGVESGRIIEMPDHKYGASTLEDCLSGVGQYPQIAEEMVALQKQEAVIFLFITDYTQILFSDSDAFSTELPLCESEEEFDEFIDELPSDIKPHLEYDGAFQYPKFKE